MLTTPQWTAGHVQWEAEGISMPTNDTIKNNKEAPMNINDIKPGTQGISDKYSWNLYAYLKKNKGEHRVLWDRSKNRPLHPMDVYVLQGTIGKRL